MTHDDGGSWRNVKRQREIILSRLDGQIILTLRAGRLFIMSVSVGGLWIWGVLTETIDGGGGWLGEDFSC